MADPDKAVGQDVLQKATQKLHGVELQHPVTAATGIVPVTEAHGVRIGSRDPAVGDGDTMGVASQVLEHLLGPAEGRLGVHHPPFAAQLPAERSEATGICQLSNSTVEVETTGSEALLERGQHLAAKEV